jgi:thiol-disulfide isomerase/thioredoxin
MRVSILPGIRWAWAVGFCFCLAIVAASCNDPSAVAPQADEARLDENSSNPLLGKRVPPLIAVDPNGNKIDLSKHWGKDVILLDFWATWCQPCLMAMPEVIRVADQFKDRGLVFYTVNVAEDPDTVKEFLAHHKLDLPVAMDFNQQIQHMYQARDLPHTIVIGKDGRLQVDHRGYWRGFGEELAAQVEALLDGKDLVGGSTGE